MRRSRCSLKSVKSRTRYDDNRNFGSGVRQHETSNNKPKGKRVSVSVNWSLKYRRHDIKRKPSYPVPKREMENYK